MGIRTPDLLHAMRIRSVDLRRRESNGEPPTCGNCLSGSGCVRGCLNTVAPVSGSPALSAPERGPVAIEFKEHCCGFPKFPAVDHWNSPGDERCGGPGTELTGLSSRGLLTRSARRWGWARRRMGTFPRFRPAA